MRANATSEDELTLGPVRNSDFDRISMECEVVVVNREVPTHLQAAELLNQQIWCWGRDIECADGNLLVQYGFQRIEKPLASRAASFYRLELSPTVRVAVRGFGLFIGDDRWGGMFLRRYEFRPQFTPASDLARPAWLSDDLPPLVLPRPHELARCQRLLIQLTDWIRAYEVWIGERVGIAYRRETLTTVLSKPKWKVPPEEMALAWQIVGLAAADYPERFIVCSDSQEQP